MKFKFKIQQYQTDAVQNTVDVFNGQPHHSMEQHLLEMPLRTGLFATSRADGIANSRNHRIILDAHTLLRNINRIQNLSGIPPSAALAKGIAPVNLDIEMETGTGKTYVYIKTMFELYRHYGWGKYVVVVPSIAIREGVHKSF